ncbi:MAG: hypothetical protein AAGL89_09135 [Pseudomonadota bacterium]
MHDRSRHTYDLLPSLAEFVELITEPARETSDHLSVEEMTVELPVEVQLISDGAGDGGMSIHASAPTQQVATSVLPIWHSMRLTIRAVPHE